MKKLIPFLVFIISFSVSNAQEGGFFTIGVNSALIANDPLHGIIDRYNENTYWLSEDVEHFGWNTGILLACSFVEEKAMYTFGWSSRTQSRVGNGFDSTNVECNMDFNFRYNYMFFNIFYNFVDGDVVKMGPGLGGGLGTYKILIKETQGERVLREGDPQRNHYFSLNILFHLSIYMGPHVFLNFQPYIHLPLGDISLVPLDNEINPTYTPRVDKDDLTFPPLAKGFSISLNFGGSD
ncbi:MAG: hypothetical protein C0592_05390 [Marinilabiliales bacterium]|nr:MAG: hypothetical protein C0592_05390 [Marinilabiliales bacterium]